MKSAGPIHLLERDYFLELDQPVWPPLHLRILKPGDEAQREPNSRPGPPPKVVKDPTWQAASWELASDHGGEPTHLHRKLFKSETRGTDIVPEGRLVESILRFPSAPLFGIQRKRDYQYRMRPIHQHTMRLLTSALPRTRPIERIFVFLNGLNEIDHMGFYYELADRLLSSEGSGCETACLICPYPAHLTRYPMVGRYAEKPLQRFITDPSDLFRQYLRFMIEMQWLLSILVPVSYYPVAPGLPLLAESGSGQPSGGRCDAEILSRAMLDEWSRIYESSRETVRVSEEGTSLKEMREGARRVTQQDILQSILTIRRLIDWRSAEKPLSGYPPDGPLPKPAVHIVGYSLGGYLAQSAFFTWPFAISSCTSLCSGAALHTLRPVRMAHEEEWRAITHGLKYEIESGLLEGRIRLDRDSHLDVEHLQDHRSVCGIRASYFSSHFQIFTDVFLQDPHGSYRPRVSEFAPRLLFVVGGNDPIVSTQSVLEASPPEGINLIEIANLSHFIAVAEGEWASFWLPTVAKVVSSLADHSEGLLAASILYNLWSEETTGPARGQWFDPPSRGSIRSTHRDPEPLDSESLRTTLSELVGELAKGAFVFVLRNQIPFTLMGPRLLHRRGSAPHYEDFQIRRFWQEIQAWLESMIQHSSRITMVLPGRLNEWFVKTPSILSGKSLPLARELHGRESLARIWKDFLLKWESAKALYRFDPQAPPTISETAYPLEELVRQHTATPPDHPVLNCLPDVWIGLTSPEAKRLAGDQAGRDGIHDAFRSKVLSAYSQSLTARPDRTDGLDWVRDALKASDLRIIRVSAAQGSSRFLGERIWDPRDGLDLLVHSALALARSTACTEVGSFARDWPGR